MLKKIGWTVFGLISFFMTFVFGFLTDWNANWSRSQKFEHHEASFFLMFLFFTLVMAVLSVIGSAVSFAKIFEGDEDDRCQCIQIVR